MKTYIIGLILFISVPAQAGFLTGLVVGSALSPHNTVAQNHDSFYMLTQSIEGELWSEKYNPTAKEVVIDVSGFDAIQLQSIYKVKGYDVKLKGTNLVFNQAAQFEQSLSERIQRAKDFEQSKADMDIFATKFMFYLKRIAIIVGSIILLVSIGIAFNITMNIYRGFYPKLKDERK
jgi:hypothetical protein